MSTKLPIEFVFKFCEFTKVILWSKNWCELFVLKTSGRYTKYIHKFKGEGFFFKQMDDCK